MNLPNPIVSFMKEDLSILTIKFTQLTNEDIEVVIEKNLIEYILKFLKRIVY